MSAGKAACVASLLIGLIGPAQAATTIGWGTGVDARLGSGAVFVGVGGGPTVRMELPHHLDVHGEARWLVLAGNTAVLRAGAAWSPLKGAWQPDIGLDATLYWGASLRAVTSANPDLAANVAPALQVRLDPLRWTGERWAASALRLEVGSGWDRGAPALSFGVTLAEAGIRF